MSLALAYLALSNAWQGVYRAVRPDVAAMMLPVDGLTMAARSQAMIQLASPDPKKIDRGLMRRAGEEARDALAREPLAATAFRNLSFAIDDGGDRSAARRLMVHAVGLTRRDANAQFWLIRDFAEQKNLPEMVRHMDQSLRSSSGARQRLLPLMREAMASPDMIPIMLDLLLKRPPWAEMFWSDMQVGPQALVNAAKLRLEVARRGIAVDQAFDQQMIDRLVQQGEFDTALSLYRMVARTDWSEDQGNLLHNGAFGHEPKASPFEWELLEPTQADAQIDPSLGALEIDVIEAGKAPVIRQPVRLQGGAAYRLTGRLQNFAREQQGVLQAEIFCAEPGKARGVAIGRFDGNQVALPFVAQPGCTWFWVQLTTLAGDEQTDTTLTVKDMVLTRAGG